MKVYVKQYFKIILLSMTLNFMIESIGRKSLWEVVVYLGNSPLVFMLNSFIIMLPFMIFFLTRRKIFVLILLSVFWLFIGLVNGVLLSFRTTPFTAADLRLLKYGLNMLDTYMNWFQIIGLGTGIFILVLGTVVLWKRAPVDSGLVIYKTGVAIAVVSIISVLTMTQSAMTSGLVAVQFGNIGQAYKDYGFAYCYSNSLFNTGISKPDDYGTEVLAEIEQEGLITENVYGIGEYKTPNIIMIQLESFFDPFLWKNNPVEEDPIPFFRYLTEAYPSGFLSVPSVGAGTANTEFEAITGMNLDFFGPGEYPYKTVLNKTSCESTAFDLKNLGYTAHAIHNNEATFYDRNHVFPQLGFDTFTPIEYMYDIERNPGGWCKDLMLTDEIIKTLDSTEGSDFIYTISVQGHGAYPDFDYYCKQIGEMDEFIKGLIRTLNSRKEPAVVVLYGDHLPGFAWDASEMKNRSLYQTQYVVWNNLQLPKADRNLEAYQLSAYVLDMLGIHEGTMIRYHQNYLNTKHPDKKKYLADMEVLEYDILYGDHEIYGGDSPYQTADMKMGILPVTVDKIVYNSSNILVFGDNFNEYSKVTLNGKTLETMYVWSQLLVAKDVPDKKMEEAQITVRQVGKDKVPLGEAVQNKS